MTYKVLLKRHSDKNKIIIYEDEDMTHQFLIDLREKSFGVLHGRILKGKIEDLELFLVYEINYDSYDTKSGWAFYVGPFNGNLGANAEYLSTFDLESGFSPKEKDITRDLLVKYYQTNRYKLEKNINIKSVTYNKKEGKLFFDNKPFDLSSSSNYITIAKTFFDNGGEEIGLGEITDNFVGGTDDLEKHMKNVRGYIHHFNSIIEKEFNIPELIRVEEKALHNTFPVILINSDSD